MADQRRLQRELAEQARWQPQPSFADAPQFNTLVQEEFQAPEARAERNRAALVRLLRHAAAQVPWWQRRFEALDAGPESLARPGALARLPVLDRATLQANFRELNARRLPAGELLAAPVRSAGSTGTPLELPRTARSQGSVGLLRQRAFRWFRFDPSSTQALIRRGRDLPLSPHGRVPAPGETLRLPAWMQVAHLFATGPQVGLLLRTPVPAQVDWLREQAPASLVAPGHHLEQLALAFAGEASRPTLVGMQAVAHTFTAGMRELVSGVFDAPVHLEYRLAEFGPVAATCVEGGRYHVHDGHVLVEIVDAGGRPCRAGERGRLLLTGLANDALPLLRYDTGDTAEVLEGPCACGRTLPSFADVCGHERPLPRGLESHRLALQRALLHMPGELVRPLRGYQLRQGAGGSMALYLLSDGPPAPALVQRLLGAWRDADQASGVSLSLAVEENAEPQRAADGSVPGLLLRGGDEPAAGA